MFYVYEYFIVDTLEVFYVGKGTGKRRFELHNRSKWFKSIYAKHRCAVRVVRAYLTNEEACALEMERIAELRSAGKAKCNFTAGGTGFSPGSMNPRRIKPPTGALNGQFGVRRVGADNHFYGRKHTDETKLKISLNRKGKGGQPGALNPMYGKGMKGADNPMYGVKGTKHHNSRKFLVTYTDGTQEELHSSGCEKKFGIAFVRIRDTGGILHYKKKTTNDVYEGTQIDII